MDGACGTYEVEETCVQSVGGGGGLTERDKSEDLSIDRRIKLKLILKKGDGKV